MRKRAMPPPLLFDNVVMVAGDVFRVALSVAATACCSCSNSNFVCALARFENWGMMLFATNSYVYTRVAPSFYPLLPQHHKKDHNRMN